MEAGNGGRSGGVSFPSNSSNSSSASMRTRRKTLEESCFCGSKAVIKNLGQQRTQIDYSMHVEGTGHCNYFKWVDDDDYQGVAEGGTKKDYRTNLQVESGYDEWRLKVAWRLGSLEAEVKALKLLLIFIFVVVVINVTLCCLSCTSK
ncbi:uncharacterized protein DS421_18g632270 [Arachis hypogaea]|nr:uncharacterized protein DS421_18g632270 [Arachis hypogaea]